jgi:hypothetical protein
MNEVTLSKRGAQRKAEGIEFMMRQNIASYSMTNLTQQSLLAIGMVG